MPFSVVVPLYNKQPHIERALTSAFSQTSTPREVIVVDDGSTDGGFEWLQSCTHPLLRIERRSQPGPGGYAARNRGIAMAREDWVAFLDADDEWRPGHLEALSDALGACSQPDDITILFSGYESFFGDRIREMDAFTKKNAGSPCMLSFAQLIDEWIRQQNSPMWTSATACRRTALLTAGSFPADRCKRGGDKDTWLRVASLGRAAFTGKVTANYHRDAVNMTTNKSYANTVPCLVPTLDSLAKKEHVDLATRLARLKNQEIFNYALVSARTQGLNKTSFADFEAALDPWRFALLHLLSNPLGKVLTRGAFWGRRLIRGR